jgi:hypothetical protein
MRAGAKKKLFVFYDLLVKVESLISSKERLLLANLVFEFRHKAFLNLDLFEENPGFSLAEIRVIHREAERVFQEHSYLTENERMIVSSLIFKTYLLLENNFIQGKIRPLFFSKHFLPIILKMALLNLRDTNEDEIIFMVLNQIASSVYFLNYNIQNNLQHYDRALILLKLIFKQKFPAEYVLLTDYAQSFDDLVLKGFQNCFSDIFNTIHLAVYCDFKNLLYVAFYSQKERVGVLDLLGAAEISFHVFLDILFFVLALTNEIDYFQNLEQENFLSQVRKSLQKQQNNFAQIFAQVLQLIHELLDQDLYFEKYSELVRNIYAETSKKSHSFK